MHVDQKPSKRKNIAPGTITYYWNRALFARSFEIVTALPPDECANRLYALHKNRGMFGSMSRTAQLTERADDLYDFDLRVKRTGRGVNYTSVKATGVIVVDKGLNQTVVRGDVRLGWLYLAGMFSVVPVLLLWWFWLPFFPLMFLVPMLAIFCVSLVYYLWQSTIDYRTLMSMIENSVRGGYSYIP